MCLTIAQKHALVKVLFQRMDIHFQESYLKYKRIGEQIRGCSAVLWCVFFGFAFFCSGFFLRNFRNVCRCGCSNSWARHLKPAVKRHGCLKMSLSVSCKRTKWHSRDVNWYDRKIHCSLHKHLLTMHFTSLYSTHNNYDTTAYYTTAWQSITLIIVSPHLSTAI